MTPKPTRISFVIQKLFGLKGGAERVFLETAGAFAARGFDVEILVFDNGSGTPRYETKNIPITNLFPMSRTKTKTSKEPRGNKTPSVLKSTPHAGILGHLKWAGTHGVFERRLRSALRKSSPDLVVAFLPPAITSAVRACKKLGIPVIASTHNLPDEDFGDGPRWDQNPVYRRRARQAVNKADAITVLQQEFSDWFPKDATDKIHILPNPIRRVAAKSAGEGIKENLILSVGRLTAIKRYDLLVTAWSDLHEKFPNWSVEIYGEGPEERQLADQITSMGLAGSMRLCGVTDDIGTHYDRAAIFCHPSKFEGFGLVVAEAMSHGVPTIAFEDCSGVNKLVTHGVDGLLIKRSPDAVDAIRNALEILITDQDKRRSYGLKATQITSKYSPEHIYDQWVTLARSLTDPA